MTSTNSEVLFNSNVINKDHPLVLLTAERRNNLHKFYVVYLDKHTKMGPEKDQFKEDL